MATRESWHSRPRQAKGGGVEYHIDSLPPETQLYLRTQAGQAASEPSAQTLAEAQKFATEKALRLSLRELQDPVVQKKLRVARIIEQTPRHRRDGTGIMGAMKALGEEYGVTPMQIRRWCEEVRSWRVATRRPHVSLCETSIELPRSVAFDQEALAAGIALYAENIKAGAKAAYQALAEAAPERGWRIGDYTSFTRLLKKIPDRAWDYIRQGPVGFELGNAPKIVRSWLSVPVYEVLCGDQNIPDYEVVETSTGEVYTPNLYLWMDCTSRAWTGLWPALGAYNRYTVGYSLREACRLGVPGEVFTDWGKPEVSKYSAQLVAALSGYMGLGDWSDYAGRFGARDQVEGGVKHRKAQPGIPWKKPIENQFNVLRTELLNRFTPGFRQREGDAWVMKQRNQALKRARADGRLLTTEEFLELIRDIAQDHNTKACQVQEQSAKIVPGEVLARGLQQAPRQVWDEVTLDLLFLPRMVRRPRQSLVRVTFGGEVRHYYAPELSRLGKGESVQVSADPFDPERPAVLTTLGGDLIGLAEPWQTQRPDDREGLSHKIARQRELMRWWRKEVEALRQGYDIQRIPRIAAVTKTAKAAADQERARPDKAAAARADAKIIALYGS